MWVRQPGMVRAWHSLSAYVSIQCSNPSFLRCKMVMVTYIDGQIRKHCQFMVLKPSGTHNRGVRMVLWTKMLKRQHSKKNKLHISTQATKTDTSLSWETKRRKQGNLNTTVLESSLPLLSFQTHTLKRKCSTILKVPRVLRLHYRYMRLINCPSFVISSSISDSHPAPGSAVSSFQHQALPFHP